MPRTPLPRIISLTHGCRMGGAKEARRSCRASKAIPISRVCEDDGFREGLNPSYELVDHDGLTHDDIRAAQAFAADHIADPLL